MITTQSNHIMAPATPSVVYLFYLYLTSLGIVFTTSVQADEITVWETKKISVPVAVSAISGADFKSDRDTVLIKCHTKGKLVKRFDLENAQLKDYFADYPKDSTRRFLRKGVTYIMEGKEEGRPYLVFIEDSKNAFMLTPASQLGEGMYIAEFLWRDSLNPKFLEDFL